MNPDARIDAHTALIAIDMQAGFDLAASSNPDVEANGLRLLQGARDAGLPLIHVRHDSIKPGSPFAPGLAGNALRAGFAPRAGEALVAKTVNAAFIGTDLDLRLRRLGVRTLLLFGLSTDMCVSTTARVAANLGYRVLVVGDACAAFDVTGPDGVTVPAAQVHHVHLATLHAEFARVLDTGTALAQMRELAPVPA